MTSWNKLGVVSYKQYIASSYFKKLTEKYIKNNPNASCFVCSKRHSLLIHHVSYSNLGNERLKRDIYVVCFDCHEGIHTIQLFGYPIAKTKLRKKNLLIRMYYKKIKYCIQNREYFHTLYYFLLCLIWIVRNDSK